MYGGVHGSASATDGAKDDMDAITPTATAPEQPATIPIGQASDLRTYEEARSKGLREIPNPEAPSVESDPEIDADPELAKGIDEIEPPKAEETPAEKAARTRRHKQAAIKQRITKLARARDGEKERADKLESELKELRGRTPVAEPVIPAGAPASETRPKPMLKDFPLEKFKDEDDPYAAQGAALAEALTDWKIEQRDHAATTSRLREQAEAKVTAREALLNQSEADAKGRYADYDAVLGAARFKATPSSEYVRESIAESGVYADLVYHLCKHPERMHAILAQPNSRAVDIAIGAEIAEVKAALKAKASPPEPPKVTSASEPVAPVTAGAATGAVTKNPKDMTLDEWDAYRAAGGGRRR